jgi:hypothetical protein
LRRSASEYDLSKLCGSVVLHGLPDMAVDSAFCLLVIVPYDPLFTSMKAGNDERHV